MLDDLVVQMERFCQVAKTESWLAESASVGPDVSAAVVAYRTFQQRSFDPRHNMVCVELEWRGRGHSLQHISRDFYAFYGLVGEDTQFIQRVLEPDAVVFTVVSGDSHHGHVMRFRITGNRVAEVIQSYREAQSSRQGAANSDNRTEVT